ncbi:response regulator transcription factor [Peredibacter starrii]|uniref:Response regulator transcription factor n=1 Tax=Peredibacter starrii TaxID=28202 RepID=A0AAX4HMA8_9BACT|nr:response regulator transcription factor [Peredibacter starrii]WPU64263.1 response regulator transcription factor [Peredibacter starrii]
MKNATILVIEDEQDIRDLISFQLKSEGHNVLIAESVDKAIGIVERPDKIDLFIIDWMLPGVMSGLEFTKKLRAQKNYKDTPIVMITALTQPENIVAALDAGADDYITKPFDLKVLEARVRVQLRELKTDKTDDDTLDFGLMKIEVSKCRVIVEKDEINLTSTEFKILSMLAQKPGHVFTREQFINNIQGENIFVTGRTIDTHIAGLRKKIGPAANMIETIRGIGYRFKDVL